ncbi:hypothetical protein Ciccas_008365, partial [Cichlidogyrus casuarinus]
MNEIMMKMKEKKINELREKGYFNLSELYARENELYSDDNYAYDRLQTFRLQGLENTAAPSGGTNMIFDKPMYHMTEEDSMFDEDEKMSGMLMQWGQFLDHDLDFTPVDASTSRFSDGLACNETCLNDPPCFPILVPPQDPRIKHRCIGFARSVATCGSGSTSLLTGRPHFREQLNQITSFIDASNVYSSDETEANVLRDVVYDEGKMLHGMTTEAGKYLLPFNIRGQ